MKFKSSILFKVFSIVLLLPALAFAVDLTSVTLDPENSDGATTNAPGAWSSNTGDPLAQCGVQSSEGEFLNLDDGTGVLGEIDIPLKPGINKFTLIANGIFPANAFYGAVLFFDGQATPPQIAVYNENGNLGDFQIQAAGNKIMGGANGGLFFDEAPGTAIYIAADGTKIEVLSFVINSMGSNVDEISYGAVGSDGISDTTAELILYVTPPKMVAGTVEFMTAPLSNCKVILRQKGETKQITYTDAEGNYSFEDVVSGKNYRVVIHGPTIPVK